MAMPRIFLLIFLVSLKKYKFRFRRIYETGSSEVRMFERKHERLAPVAVFIRRMVASIAVAGLLVAVALFMGVAGYHWIAGLGWVDSLLEASMILGGMGPVSPLPTQASKVFASGYALFSGLMFIAVMGVVLSPLLHRFLHKFHIDDKGEHHK